ncbi:MAG TPA: hypothetical protein VFT81_07110 [Dermatophilaceae bacterium]|nr:hypothetical protein [Dermatophilaceae bacterium]
MKRTCPRAPVMLLAVLALAACGAPATGMAQPDDARTAESPVTATSTVRLPRHADGRAFIAALKASGKDITSSEFRFSVKLDERFDYGNGETVRTPAGPKSKFKVDLRPPGRMRESLEFVVHGDTVLVLGLARTADGPDWVRLSPGTPLANLGTNVAALSQQAFLVTALEEKSVATFAFVEESQSDLRQPVAVYEVRVRGRFLATEAVGGDLTQHVRLTITLDEHDRVVSVAGEEGDLRWSLGHRWFNEPVDVVIPPADEISTLKGY